MYRSCDPRYPFLWEDSSQPEARWHGAGEGPAHYFADTPDGAWAEFVRHEEITDYVDLAMVRRAVWAVEIDESECVAPALPYATVTGGQPSYDACRDEARQLRSSGTKGIVAPSAAVLPSTAAPFHVANGLQLSATRDTNTFVLFDPRPDLDGWLVVAEGRPSIRVLDQVRPLRR